MKQDNFKTKFNEFVELIDFTSLILIFDLTQSHETMKFQNFLNTSKLIYKQEKIAF